MNPGVGIVYMSKTNQCWRYHI